MRQPPKRGKRRNYSNLKHAARIFTTQTTNASQIARIIGVTPRTVKGYATDPMWHLTLDVLGYIGDRSFTKQPTRCRGRDTYADRKYAEYLYKASMTLSSCTRKHAYWTEMATQIPRQKIRRWAREGQWLASGGPTRNVLEDVAFAEYHYKREKRFYNHPKTRSQLSWIELIKRDCYRKSSVFSERQHCIYYTAKLTDLPYQQIEMWQELYDW